MTDLMKALSHIVFSALVRLTDTVPKHNGPKNIYFKNYTFCTEDLSFHIGDHDNIETILLLQYCDIDNIVPSPRMCVRPHLHPDRSSPRPPAERCSPRTKPSCGSPAGSRVHAVCQPCASYSAFPSRRRPIA